MEAIGGLTMFALLVLAVCLVVAPLAIWVHVGHIRANQRKVIKLLEDIVAQLEVA